MTPKKKNISRRDFMKNLGLVGATAALTSCAPQALQGQPEPAAVEPTAAPIVPEAPAVPTPVPGGPKLGGVLVEGRVYETTSLNPLEALHAESGQIIMPRIYETLATVGPDMNLQLKLAESFEMADEKDWIVKIKKGVKFHNGREMTVEDIKYSYDAHMDADIGSNAKQYTLDIDNVEIVDSETIRFQMKRLNYEFPKYQHWIYIMPQEAQDQPLDWLTSNPIGTGPFKVKDWKPDNEMILEKNGDYWMSGRPYIDGIHTKIYPEESTAIAGLRAGEVDLLTLEDPNNFQLLTTNPNINLTLTPANGSNFWCFNSKRETMADLKVRQAISQALNREEILQFVGAGLGSVSGIIPPAFADVHVPPAELPFYDYNVEKAKALLKESSFPDGFKMDCVYINSLPVMKNGAQLFKQYVEAIGIEVELKGMESSVWVDTVVNKADFDFTTNLDFGGPTPGAILSNFAVGSALDNFYGPSFAELDELVAKANATKDAAEYKQIWRDIQVFVAENLTSIWTYSRTHVVATQKWVQGFVAYPDKQHRGWQDVWLMGKK